MASYYRKQAIVQSTYDLYNEDVESEPGSSSEEEDDRPSTSGQHSTFWQPEDVDMDEDADMEEVMLDTYVSTPIVMRPEGGLSDAEKIRICEERMEAFEREHPSVRSYREYYKREASTSSSATCVTSTASYKNKGKGRAIDAGYDTDCESPPSTVYEHELDDEMDYELGDEMEYEGSTSARDDTYSTTFYPTADSPSMADAYPTTDSNPTTDDESSADSSDDEYRASTFTKKALAKGKVASTPAKKASTSTKNAAPVKVKKLILKLGPRPTA
ncbi:hypothetical protein BD626DRAFT_539622 [Schizophyllum amplum]|uniref:Uncharacterized protein n=1 Tax=Schizophyllum amplum TaxID=97359 RepID=A0A550C2P8_9AGAR|nr:hypothetical protein BD626DRAFT_539622 [Auriculariopsis ampla]